ncbi:hypothetical protein WA026_003832 [Henosepilachna vigintioctopunctata]|uniref:Uncharacterized protein n=1 Tax=Henosepilachna vigintioctopunctata TaxID=420089 RepID=A0AAW1U800_9CUCU
MDENCLIAAALALSLKTKQRKKRQWSKAWFLKRNSLSHTNLMRELRLEPCDWLNYLRMDEDAYLLLLQLVTPFVKKQNTNMREAITPHERLSATLRFLLSTMLDDMLDDAMMVYGILYPVDSGGNQPKCRNPFIIGPRARMLFILYI